jgi:hypothetical protein
MGLTLTANEIEERVLMAVQIEADASNRCHVPMLRPLGRPR